MFKKKNSVSFIIPAYNCQDYIQESIDSIYNRNYSSGDEVIVINDCSTDRTEEIILDLYSNHENFVYKKHDYNKGTAGASRNTGIGLASNKIIFCLDSDNILLPESIVKLKKYMIYQKAEAASFGSIKFFKGTKDNIIDKWAFNQNIKLMEALKTKYWPGPSGNYMFTKEIWVRAGRCPEPTILNQTLDSWSFGIAILGVGGKMVTMDDSYYLHRVGIKSHWVREIKNGNVSIAATSAILPFLKQLDKEFVDYILSYENIFNWFENNDD